MQIFLMTFQSRLLWSVPPANYLCIYVISPETFLSVSVLELQQLPFLNIFPGYFTFLRSISSTASSALDTKNNSFGSLKIDPIPIQLLQDSSLILLSSLPLTINYFLLYWIIPINIQAYCYIFH